MKYWSETSMLAAVLSYVKAINNEGFKTDPTIRINKALKAFLDPGLKGKQVRSK